MKQSEIIFYIILFLGAGIFVTSCNSSSPTVDREILNQKGKLAIGVYLGRTVEDEKTVSVVYEYEVDRQLFENRDRECFLDSDKAKDHFYFTNYPLLKGNEFVVLYDSINPEISIIRLDYPLRDSTDFKSYERKFEKMRSEKE